MTLAIIHHHDDNQGVDDDIIWYDYHDDDQCHDGLRYHDDHNSWCASVCKHMNIWISEMVMVMVIMIMIVMIISIIIQGACQSANIWTLNIRDGGGYGDHDHDNHDHIVIIIQGARQSTNLSSLGSWSTVPHSHKSHWHSNSQVEIWEQLYQLENEYVKVQKISFSKGLWCYWDEPKIANDHHDCKQFVHWA